MRDARETSLETIRLSLIRSLPRSDRAMAQNGDLSISGSSPEGFAAAPIVQVDSSVGHSEGTVLISDNGSSFQTDSLQSPASASPVPTVKSSPEAPKSVQEPRGRPEHAVGKVALYKALVVPSKATSVSVRLVFRARRTSPTLVV